MSSADDLVARIRQIAEHARVAEQWREQDSQRPPPEFPILPEDLHGLTCGAKTRKGTPCKRKDIYDSGRCHLHGGLSTGPKTAEGKAKVALNGRCPKRKLEAKPMGS